MDEMMKRLNEIADQDDRLECNCDSEPPYEKCPGCAADSLLNELSEIAWQGLKSIEKKIKEKDSE